MREILNKVRQKSDCIRASTTSTGRAVHAMAILYGVADYCIEKKRVTYGRRDVGNAHPYQATQA